jgi:transposase
MPAGYRWRKRSPVFGLRLGRYRLRRDHAEEMRAAGMSLRAIAKRLNVPLTTIADHLNGRARKG